MTQAEYEKIYNGWNNLRNEEIVEDFQKEREEIGKVMKEIAEENGTEYKQEELQYRIEGSRAIEFLLQIISIAQSQIDLLNNNDTIDYKRAVKIEREETKIISLICALQELITPTV